ncbi:MAG: hypothetical protein WBB27_17755 [Maribacter sp.]
MAKKQNVVEKELTLDLTNISKVANRKELPEKEKVPERGIKQAKPKKKDEREPESRAAAKAKTAMASEPKDEAKDKKHLRLVVSKDHITDFETLFKRFVEETQTYWVNTSRVHLFVLGTLYLEQKYKRGNTYHDAPDDFVTFISRKGNRPKTEESTLRKTDATPMFFEVEPEVFHAYHSLIYSFLLANNDVHNLSYSASYFFKDFLDLLENSFKSFCSFGKKNS